MENKTTDSNNKDKSIISITIIEKDLKKDDVVKCPACHYPKDRKAIYCRWCNDSFWEKYVPKAEKMNKEYQKTITDDNLTYGKYKNYNPTTKEKEILMTIKKIIILIL